MVFGSSGHRVMGFPSSFCRDKLSGFGNHSGHLAGLLFRPIRVIGRGCCFASFGSSVGLCHCSFYLSSGCCFATFFQLPDNVSGGAAGQGALVILGLGVVCVFMCHVDGSGATADRGLPNMMWRVARIRGAAVDLANLPPCTRTPPKGRACHETVACLCRKALEPLQGPSALTPS